MAVGNRTDVKSACTTQITPTVTVAKHLVALNDNVNDSAVFKKDVVDNINAAATGSATADFSTNDQVNITMTVDTAITITGLVDGQVGKLTVIKASTNVVSFVGVDTVNSGISYGQERMEYYITSVNSQITITQINEQMRTFNFSGTPAAGIVIDSQKNFIIGRQAHINLSLTTTGLTIQRLHSWGSLPFYSETKAITQVNQGLSMLPLSTNQTEGAYALYAGGSGDFFLDVGNNSDYIISGVIAI